MKTYAVYGYNEFVICAGYKQHVIKEWFADYFLHTSDITFDYTRLEQQKNIPMLLKALRIVVDIHPEVILEIYGDGSEKKRIEQLIRELNLEKNVQLKGFCNNVDERIVNAYICSLIIFYIFIYWTIDFLEKNSMTLLWVGNFTPLTLLFGGVLFAGYDEKLMRSISAVSKYVAIIFLGLALYYTIEFYIDMGRVGIRYGNSNIMSFFMYRTSTSSNSLQFNL